MSFRQASNPIRVAVISMNGLSPGGTETFLRKIIMDLPKQFFECTFFYCDLPLQKQFQNNWGGNELHLQELITSGVECKKFRIQEIDFTSKSKNWLGSDLFQIFSQDNFDVILTGRVGNPAYPYNEIRKTPIVDTIHIKGGLDLQANIMKSIHLSGENAYWYIKRGGLIRDVTLMYPLIESTRVTTLNYRDSLKIKDKIVVGMHQRNDDSIFSDIPLKAFSHLERQTNLFFLMLNGSQKYVEQAKELNLQNVHFLPTANNEFEKQLFLNTLDIYCHGRADGETNSAAIAEAMRHSLPVITHRTQRSNGQREQVSMCGFFAHNLEEYIAILEKLVSDSRLRSDSGQASSFSFKTLYSYERQIQRISAEIFIAYQRTHNPLIRYFWYGRNFLERRFKRAIYLVIRAAYKLKLF